MPDDDNVPHIADLVALGFTDGGRVEGEWDEEWTTHVVDGGTLRLPSGRIRIGDPFTGGLSEGPPLAIAVPPGTYPVDLAAIRRPESVEFDERVALARVRFSDTPVVRWVCAAFEGQHLGPTEVAIYGVDAGTGCFADADLAPPLDEDEPTAERFLAAFQAVGHNSACAVTHPDNPGAVVAFTSGWGDGTYASWWGLDASDSPVALVTDFDLLTRAIRETVELPLPLSSGPIQHPLLERLGVTLRRPFFKRWTVRGGGRPTPQLKVRLADGTHLPVPVTWPLGIPTWVIPKHPGATLVLAYPVGIRSARNLGDRD